ncbi:hypothetical protein BH23GEM10_BH23GEM10_07380 [soil metagenome]
MNRGRTIAVVLAVLAIAPLPVLAQGGQGRSGMRGQQAGGMMAARVLLEQGSVEFLVTKAADLGLSADQSAQLTAIGTAWSAATKESRDRVRSSMPQAGQGMGGGDRQAMMQRMQELQPVMQKLRQDDREALDEALALLNEAQQAKAKTLIEERLRPRRG